MVDTFSAAQVRILLSPPIPRYTVRNETEPMVLLKIWRMFTEGARFIDWAILIVDFLVLAVILWLDAPERFHKRKVRKRLAMVQRMMLDGHSLRESAPANVPDPTHDVALQWVQSVQTWIDRSDQSLRIASMQAALAFIRRDVAPDVLFGGITERANARHQFAELLHRLENLRNIMEKADVYF